MWRLTIVTENNSASLLCSEQVAKSEISAWSVYAARREEEEEAAESIGNIYRNHEGFLVREVKGWYEPDRTEEEMKQEPGRIIFPTIIAYRFVDVVGLSAQKCPFNADVGDA